MYVLPCEEGVFDDDNGDRDSDEKREEEDNDNDGDDDNVDVDDDEEDDENNDEEGDENDDEEEEDDDDDEDVNGACEGVFLTSVSECVPMLTSTETTSPSPYALFPYTGSVCTHHPPLMYDPHVDPFSKVKYDIL